MQHDLRHITDFIFKQKEKYKNLSDDEKEKFFFIVNRKFARQFPKHAQFLNKKNIDKSSAMDIWYFFFVKQRTTDIPNWYWFKLSNKGTKKTPKGDDINFLMDFYKLREFDVDYLLENYPDEIKEELKKIKKFNK